MEVMSSWSCSVFLALWEVGSEAAAGGNHSSKIAYALLGSN